MPPVRRPTTEGRSCLRNLVNTINKAGTGNGVPAAFLVNTLVNTLGQECPIMHHFKKPEVLIKAHNYRGFSCL